MIYTGQNTASLLNDTRQKCISPIYRGPRIPPSSPAPIQALIEAGWQLSNELRRQSHQSATKEILPDWLSVDFGC